MATDHFPLIGSVIFCIGIIKTRTRSLNESIKINLLYTLSLYTFLRVYFIYGMYLTYTLRGTRSSIQNESQ
jgi:hypothetical protein